MAVELVSFSKTKSPWHLHLALKEVSTALLGACLPLPSLSLAFCVQRCVSGGTSAGEDTRAYGEVSGLVLLFLRAFGHPTD